MDFRVISNEGPKMTGWDKRILRLLVIARMIREQLEIIFYRMLLKQRPTSEEKALQVTTVLLSWGIFGASVEWRRNNKQIPP